jgi:hypothetical protein
LKASIGPPGIAAAPKNQGCHGATVEMQGTSFDLALRRNRIGGFRRRGDQHQVDLVLEDQVGRDSAARLGLDWLSLTTISTGTVLPPTLTPLASPKAGLPDIAAVEI